MRLFVLMCAILFLPSFAIANDINISTTTKNGKTIFYLQAGAFTLEKQAVKRQQELAQLIKQPIEIKKLADKRLFLIQIGPIKDYLAARALKDTLSQARPLSINQKTQSLDPSQPKEQRLNKDIAPNTTLWNLRNADIHAVIAEVSRVTGKNFAVDPRVQGKISIISSTPLSNQELYQVFLSVLQVNGYAAIPTGEIIKIIPVIDAKGLAPGLINELRNPPRGDDMMVSVVPVRYVPAEQLVPVLRPLMPQWSNVSAYAPSNMIILSGRANNIRRLTCIIKQVDSSDASGVDIVHLRQSLAMDVAATLKDLVKAQPNQANREQITIASDDKTNSILISGNRTDRIRIRMLLLKLDRHNRDGTNATTQVVYLHYLRAEDLVPILAGIAQANFSGIVGTTIGTITRPILDSTNPASNLTYPSTTPSSGASTAVAAPAPVVPAGHTDATANTSTVSTQNEGSTKPTIQIIAEPNTNSIILNAPVAIIRTLRSVISKVDIKPAQLLIEAMVAEINQDEINDLGIEFGSDSQTGNPGNFRPGFAIINSKARLANFQAQIYALATEEKANILSTPSVVVLDNRQAKILVGKQVSIASTSYPNNAGGTTTASPYTTFDRVNVALHLYVRPQITKGCGIQMQIDQGNDTLDPSSINNNTTPTFSISSIVTSVNVESGDIVVLGGLTQDGIGNNNVTVPILAGIPGLGRLFQHNIRNREKKVLMVFIKPIILRTEHDTVMVSGDKYENTREYELEWVRSQEVYNQNDQESVLPPLVTADLPIPFSGNSLQATK
ncbi:MAG: GspD family T2SS secretin variant LspD [Legionella sp.]|nr:GspD family T2SS secretin variant LspD [Legionella sp.]